MNSFDLKLKKYDHYPLTAKEISTLQVNMGYKCNLACTHCHVEASPLRTEIMPLNIIAGLLDILRSNDVIRHVDITGGSPELNPYFKYFVKSCADMGKNITVRTNLAIYLEPGLEDIPEFLAAHKVKIVASLPCYTEEGVDGQRGSGTYKKSITALKQLNRHGYGNGTGLEIDLMFNPANAGIAPDQHMLENAYRGKLHETHGITFNHLIALSNMPIGRLGRSMSANEKQDYMRQLEEKFNPDTLNNVMCRHLISISPDGTLYDCDFWQMIKLPVKNRDSNTVDTFDYAMLKNRGIVTASLCFMCTAGAGASCSGSLT